MLGSLLLPHSLSVPPPAHGSVSNKISNQIILASFANVCSALGSRIHQTEGFDSLELPKIVSTALLLTVLIFYFTGLRRKRAERRGVRRTGRNRVLCPTLKEAQPHVLGPDDLLSGPWPLSGSTEEQKPTPMLPPLDPRTWQQTLPVAAGRTRKTNAI